MTTSCDGRQVEQRLHRIHSIQALRFLAAAAVVHTHAVVFAREGGAPAAHANYGYVAEFGSAGVDVFFVISGFIIAQVGSRGRQQPAQFLWRRILRIAPFYWLMSIPWFFAAYLRGEFSAPRTLSTFLFFPASAGSVVAPYLNVGWTLCFEMLFYLAFAATLTRKRAAWTIPILLFLVFFCLGQLRNDPIFHFFGQPMIAEFLAGVGISRLYRKGLLQAHGLGLTLTIAAVIGFCYTATADMGLIGNSKAVLNGEAGLSRTIWWGIPSALLVAGVLPNEAGFQRPWSRGLVFLGDASYSIYLAHLTVLRGLEEVNPLFRLPGDAVVALMLGVSCAVGGLTYRFVELPLTRKLRSALLGGARR